MPCFRCGVRQTDPTRGSSPWRRGVRGDRQVLICPGCQRGRDWAADLDRCAACGSSALQCRLGEIECRDCGFVREVREVGGVGGVGGAQGATDLVTSGAPGLSEEVAEALDRMLRPGAHRSPPV